MCIIVCKPQHIEMPSRNVLKSCFLANDDGAGYMFNKDNKVIIKKGFMDFDGFYKSLMEDYNNETKEKAFVMHFRIGTQGGNVPENTHPFPISDKMEDLQQLRFNTNVGIAHNGIISLTSDYSKKTKTSDTMEFITRYLSLIIDNKNWYFNKNNIELIKTLTNYSNKFAILSPDGHIELIGDFIKDDDCFFSNYSYTNYLYHYNDSKYLSEYDDYGIEDYFEDSYEAEFEKYKVDDVYDMKPEYCPAMLNSDYSYCDKCLNYAQCYLDEEDDEPTPHEKCLSGFDCCYCKHKYQCPLRVISDKDKDQIGIKDIKPVTD